MPLSDATIADLAARLDQSERTRLQIERLSVTHPSITIDESYAVQRAWVEQKSAEGRKRVGYKIGLTSQAIQRALHHTEPVYGVLFDDMLFADGLDIPVARFIEPRIEAELIFVLKHRLAGPDCSISDVLAATDAVIPAIEIIDGRTQAGAGRDEPPRQAIDIIADNAGNAGVIVGGRPDRSITVDPSDISVTLYRNDLAIETGVSTAVLGHPAQGIAWLAKRLFAIGSALNPGDIVLSGSFTAPATAAKGDRFRADFGLLGMPSIRLAG